MSKKPTYEELEHRIQELEQSEYGSKHAGEALRESEERFRLAFENANVGVCLVDIDGNLARVNNRMCDIFGYSKKELESMTVNDIAHPEDKDISPKFIEKSISGEVESTVFEKRYFHKQGHIIWGQVSSSIIKDEKGDLLYFISYVQDITQRKQAEETLRESEEKYKTIIENIEDGYYEVDIAGSFTFYNDSMCKILGYSKDELTGLNNRRYMDEENAKKVFNAFNRVYKTGQPYKAFDWELIRKDGTRCYVETSVVLKRDSKGQPIGFQGIARDITERKKSEEALQKSEERYRQQYTQSKKQNQALITLNAISQAANQSLNLDQTLNDAIDKVMELFKPHSAYIRLVDDQTQEMIFAANKGLTPEELKTFNGRRKPGHGIRSLASKSGEVFIVDDIFTDPRTKDIDSFAHKINCRSLAILPLYTKHKIVGSMGIRDRKPNAFTEKDIQFFTSIGLQIGVAIENAKLYQEKEFTINELRETQKKLQQAQKMESIGTLTGGIAHDFNNILGIIIGNTELALDDVPEWNPAHSNLEEIKTASLRATKIVKQLLSFSRKTDQKLQPVEITLIIKDALKFLRSTIPTTIDIQQDIQATEETILANPTQINQIMMNLCINASQAMEQTGGNLTVNVEKVILDENSAKNYPDLSMGNYVKVTVSDTGPGIAPEIIDRIFDPYFTTKDVGKGSGMGLAVVHGIVKNHHGAISVDSKPGKGTTFSILFPTTTKKPKIEKDTTEELLLGSETVLFVDDEKSIVEMVRRMLERLGYKVKTAMAPQDALDQFSADPRHFDLVITDMTMPKMTGVMLSEKIMEMRPDIPVIICTGHSPLINEEGAKQLGIAAYVMKPINMMEIAKTIRKVLDEAKSSAHD